MGICWNLTFIFWPIISAAKCGMDVRTGLPKVTISGLALALSRASFSDPGPLAVLATSSIGVCAMVAMVSKSRSKANLASL